MTRFLMLVGLALAGSTGIATEVSAQILASERNEGPLTRPGTPYSADSTVPLPRVRSATLRRTSSTSSTGTPRR